MSDMTSERLLWVGRLVRDGESRPRSVRVWTDGTPPDPASRFEEIADPFNDPDGDVWSNAHGPATVGGFAGRLGEHALASPLRAGKVIGVGRNYGAHAKELGNEVPTSPLLFFKPSTCLLADGAEIVLPRGYDRIDMEAELVVVIGRKAKGIAADGAWDVVGGYCLGNDVSCRDLQRSDKQWTRAKGFDGFGPLGPFVRLAPPGCQLPIDSMRIRGYLDEKLVQDGAVADMIFDIPTLLEHITACMTLEPGDLIFTGTPSGVSPLQPGSRTAVDMDGFVLGRLINRVV